MRRFGVGTVAKAKTSNDHIVGGVLIILSAIRYSIAGSLTRLISADLWTMLCLR